MTFAWTTIALVVVLAVAWRFLGSYMAAVFEGRVKWLAFVERPVYRVLGVDTGTVNVSDVLNGAPGHPARPHRLSGGHQAAGDERRRLLQRQRCRPVREPDGPHQLPVVRPHPLHPGRAHLHVREDGGQRPAGRGDPRRDGGAVRRQARHRLGLRAPDGPGVPASRWEEIFEFFPRREHDAGAGLGLTIATIARTFVEAHGERIWVEDAPGTGAVFCFTLPIAAEITEEPRLAARSHH